MSDTYPGYKSCIRNKNSFQWFIRERSAKTVNKLLLKSIVYSIFLFLCSKNGLQRNKDKRKHFPLVFYKLLKTGITGHNYTEISSKLRWIQVKRLVLCSSFSSPLSRLLGFIYVPRRFVWCSSSLLVPLWDYMWRLLCRYLILYVLPLMHFESYTSCKWHFLDVLVILFTANRTALHSNGLFLRRYEWNQFLLPIRYRNKWFTCFYCLASVISSRL